MATNNLAVTALSTITVIEETDAKSSPTEFAISRYGDGTFSFTGSNGLEKRLEGLAAEAFKDLFEQIEAVQGDTD